MTDFSLRPSWISPTKPILIAGGGISGKAIITTLRPMEVELVLTDTNPEVRTTLSSQVDRTCSPQEAIAELDRYQCLITSPGFCPHDPLMIAAHNYSLPIWGEVELAWKLDQDHYYGPPHTWLAITGTNGKTTTTALLHEILHTAGIPTSLCGNIGQPILNVLAQGNPYLAIELSSFQLHWAPSLRPHAGVILNIAQDHLDWHASMDSYATTKAQIFHAHFGIANHDDPYAHRLLATSPARTKIEFTHHHPTPGQVGIINQTLTDCAFSPHTPLIHCDDLALPGHTGITDSLAASAVALCAGAPPEAITHALATFHPGCHRNQILTTIDDITYIDDSKATNPHAAEASLADWDHIIWIAGGLLKGTNIEPLIATHAHRLRAVILIGEDRQDFIKALSRHAPNVPIIEIVAGEDRHSECLFPTRQYFIAPGTPESLGTRVMTAAVDHAHRLAHRGDVVLLAPATASFDQFSSYAARGDAFAAAVATLGH